MTRHPEEVQQQGPGTTLGSEWKKQWPLIAMLFLVQVFAFGFPTFALPFVYSGATEEFGWTRQQAVLLASFKFYTSAAAALVVGRMLDAINSRIVIVSSSILGAVAMAGFLIADRLPVYYALGLLLGLSAAGLAISINVTVGRSFQTSTGTMLGIVLTGTSVAGVLLPLLIAPLMETIGWRRAMAAVSCCIWVVTLASWFLLPGADRRAASVSRPGLWPYFKSLGVTRDFWFIFVGAFIVSTVDQSMVQNQILFLKAEKGLSLDTVKWGAALLAGVGIGAKTLFGWIFDKLSILGIVLCYLFLAVSIGLSFSVAGVATMLVFVTFHGVAHAGVIVSGPILLKQRYGPQNLGMNLGIFTLCTSIGFGSGPPVMARLADKSGSYSGAFALGLAGVIVAAILLYFVKLDKNQSLESPIVNSH
jgi:nitrate/nitrite transporter NarK